MKLSVFYAAAISLVLVVGVECLSHGRPGPCQFPFVYGGIIYSACTEAYHDKPWCATETDNSNNFIGEWKNCDECKDTVSWCHMVLNQCHDHDLRPLCQKTCNVCVPERKDTVSWCDTFLDQCHDRDLRRLCQKTCNVCVPASCDPACQNGGTCNDEKKCDCLPGWTGPACDIASCAPACQNGGTYNDEKKCECLPGWTGPACDIGCGRVNRMQKIVGGQETEIHEYPWQVSLLIIRENGMFMCGGSLISDKWVLTAGHCTKNGSITVTLGDHHIYEEESAEKKVEVIRTLDHPQFNNYGLRYDYSLLELATSLDLASISPHIAPVCLPNADNPSQYDDVEAIVSGWGKTSWGGITSNVLLEASVQTMNNSECQQKYNAIRYSVIDAQICASKAGKDACGGDSGGPLVTEVDGFYNLIGVVSGGKGCALPDFPGYYARVTYVLDWITSTISLTERSAPQN